MSCLWNVRTLPRKLGYFDVNSPCSGPINYILLMSFYDLCLYRAFTYLFSMPITYSWSRHGLPMSPRASFTDHNRVLIIEDVRIEDGGTYICHASRYTTARTQKNVTLFIESKCQLRLITIMKIYYNSS